MGKRNLRILNLKALLKVLFILTSLGFIGGIFVLGIIIYISFELPQINSLSDYNPPIPSQIYSKDGELLLEISKERREITKFDEIPKRVVNSFLAAEDDNFFNHSGVDYIGIARAMIKNIKAGKIVQGASTITQQVAKSLLLSSERTFTRKIKDLLLAKKIEDKFSKEEILFLYLNQVYLGGGYYGVKAAVKGYFGKELSEATIAESALIAGLLVAPGKYSPYVNPKYSKVRQRYVLGRLYKTKKISQVEYEAALNENIRMKLRENRRMKAGYFTDWIRQRLVALLGNEEFLTNGYKVVTTIDWELQKKAEEEVAKGVKAIDRRQGYKGPIGHLASEEEILSKLIEQRKYMYKHASKYFTFYSDGTTLKEHEYEEGETEKFHISEKEKLNLVKARFRKHFEPGLSVDDPVLKFVKMKKNYKAIVTKVNNTQRMIYVSFAGGVKGMIPYEHFRWAHKREVSEERSYWSYVTRPSKIVKPGDMVLIDVIGKPRSVWKYLYKDFKKGKQNKELIAALKSEKFYLVALDQQADAQGALLSISPLTGEIVAMVGGSDFSRSQFNRVVQSNRQPGSAFKPIIYAAGLEHGYTPASILLDSPQSLGGVDDSLSWKPRNYDGKFKGEMSFRRALETSRNIPTIRLTQGIGVKEMTNFVDRMDLDVSMPQDLSLSLGSFGMNLLSLVKSYSIFPNGGRKVKLKSILSIKDRFGNLHNFNEQDLVKNKVSNTEDTVDIKNDNPAIIDPIKTNLEKTTENAELLKEQVEENPFLVNLDENQVYDERLAYLMSNLLRGVIQNGTGKGTRDISQFIGGKTGTTNNFIDAWFLGFSSKLVTGVWTGFDNNKTLGWGETGAKSALPIWKAFMRLGLKRFGEYDFATPNGIVNVSIEKETGKLANSDSSNTIMEAFVEGTQPGIESKLSDKENQELDDDIIDDDDYYTAQ